MLSLHSNRPRWLLRAAGGMLSLVLASGCGSNHHDPDRRHYVDKTGNHESPHPHAPDTGRSPPESTAEPVLVRDAAERARMERYIAEYIDRADVVKTIQLSPQELIDCIPIERQPALRAPELQGHVVEFAPPDDPFGEPADRPSIRLGDPALPDRLATTGQVYGARSETCPAGTVPVRRLTIEILDNFETLEDFLRARPPHLLTGPSDRHQYANLFVTGENWGAQSTLNVWRPYTERPTELSLSQILVSRGSGDDLETIEAGWQKFRRLYGDYEPRLFIYFTPDNYGRRGCYNLTCRGFVQVNNSVYIGGRFNNVSAHPHPSRAWEFTVRWQRRSETGSWWLKYGNTWVGYYPSRLFDAYGLKPEGDTAAFYGEIIDDRPEGRHTRTDTGSGHFPADGFGYAAYQRRVRTITTDLVWNIRPEVLVGRTDANCYDIITQTSLASWERYFYFGGPGYNDHCQ